MSYWDEMPDSHKRNHDKWLDDPQIKADEAWYKTVWIRRYLQGMGFVVIRTPGSADSIQLDIENSQREFKRTNTWILPKEYYQRFGRGLADLVKSAQKTQDVLWHSLLNNSFSYNTFTSLYNAQLRRLQKCQRQKLPLQTRVRLKHRNLKNSKLVPLSAFGPRRAVWNTALEKQLSSVG